MWARRRRRQAAPPANLLRWSEQFDNAAWTKISASITADAAVAPNGLATADKLVEAAATAQHIALQAITSLVGVSYSASCYVKAAERTQCGVLLATGGGGLLALCNLNLTTGVPLGSIGAYAVEDAGNGWWRVSVTAPATSTTTGLRVYPLLAGAATYLGDGTSGIYVWGGQLVQAGGRVPYRATQ